MLRRTKDQLGFAATVQAVRTMKAMFPGCTAVLIEDKANGSAVIETLRSEIPGIIPVNPDGGKVARAYAMQPTQEAGNIWLPDPTVDPDIETFLTEASTFPAGAHDDEVDAMTQLVNWARQREGSMGLFHFLQAQHQEAQQARAVQ